MDQDNNIKVIYYCFKCHGAYGGSVGELERCPKCNNKLRLTNVYRDQYRALTPEQKKQQLNIFKQEVEAEIERKKQLEKQYLENKEHHLLTTGYRFEGYKIVEYLDVVYGEMVIGTGMFSSFDADIADTFGGEARLYRDKLKKAREIATERAIHDSIMLGGNAIIGADIDYITFTADKIGIIFNGTSVVIEKE